MPPSVIGKSTVPIEFPTWHANRERSAVAVDRQNVLSLPRNASLPTQEVRSMKKTRGGRMTAAKKRAAKSPGGKGPIKNRPAGENIMKT